MEWLTLGHNNTQQGFSEFTDNNQKSWDFGNCDTEDICYGCNVKESGHVEESSGDVYGCKQKTSQRCTLSRLRNAFPTLGGHFHKELA